MTDIEWYLDNWARYMRAGCSPATLPKESAGIDNYTSYDTEGSYDRADLYAAEATDASIADLEPIESCAIHHSYLNAVYRFTRCPYHLVLELATKHVQESLMRKGVFVERIVDTLEKQA